MKEKAKKGRLTVTRSTESIRDESTVSVHVNLEANVNCGDSEKGSLLSELALERSKFSHGSKQKRRDCTEEISESTVGQDYGVCSHLGRPEQRFSLQ